MTRKYLWLTLCSAILLLSACQKAPFLTMDGPRSITFTDQGGNQSFTFACNREWRISSSESWIHVTPSSGEPSEDEITATLTCDANTTYGPRSTTITIIVEDVAETISIEQVQNDAILLKEKERKVPFEGGVVQIDLEANVDISATCSSSWVKQQDTKALNTVSLRFAVSENDTYEERTAVIVISQRGGSKQDRYSIIQEARPPINLSANGTANSYIVPPTNDKYVFDASVKGNSTEQLVDGESVDIVWQYKSSFDKNTRVDLISDLMFDKERNQISFYLKGDTGSVLVALKNNQGTIVWSWHLWVTDYNPEEENIHYMSGVILHNRYLGANSKEGRGYYYQWGRKDPLPYNASKVQATEETATISYSIEHPDKFIDNNYDVNNGDYNIEHSARWSTNKSLYDPCPPGWKVADGNPLFTSGWDASYSAASSDHKLYLSSPLCTPEDVFYAAGVHAGWGMSGETSSVLVWTNYGMLKNFYCARAFYVLVNNSSIDYTAYWRSSSSALIRILGASVRCQKISNQ